MPTYPSSLYKGVARSANGTTNDPGSYLWNNLTTYQELKDTVIGYGSGPNDSTTVTYNSAAKYPTDVRFGVTGVQTDTYTDFSTAQTNLSTLISAYTAAVGSITATEKNVVRLLKKRGEYSPLFFYLQIGPFLSLDLIALFARRSNLVWTSNVFTEYLFFI